MAIENLGRVIIQNDTQANVEANTGALTEVVFARDTATGAIGYSVDSGSTWTWIPATGGSSTLDGLTDVVITTPEDKQVLQYNGAEWVNAANTATGQYRQMLWEVSGGTFTFLVDASGNPLEGLMNLE